MHRPGPVMLRRRRNLVPLGLTCGVVWIAWLMLMATGQRWSLFAENWFMSVTMAFGSFIAGATSEGGGAVAFPVMTLGFGISPATARDFSLMIQSVGMTAAAVTIFASRIRVERNALLWASLGGTAGVILGLKYIAHHLPPPFAKMLFTSTWLAFAFALFWINRYRDREVHTRVWHFLPRHAVLLVGTGVIGGVISSITGSGLDICTFSLLVLRLRITETVATPTSVVLMAINALVGFAYKSLAGGGMIPMAWDYWWVCVPIVVLGAPFGAWFIRSRSRLYVATILYASIGVQFVAALIIVPQSPVLLTFSTAVFLAGLAFFHQMARSGVRRLRWLSDTGRGPSTVIEPEPPPGTDLG